MLAGIAELTARDADQPEDALDAEQWASTILGMMHAAPLPPGEDIAATFLPGFMAALESLGTRKALAALRALAAVTAPDYVTAARMAGDRLAATGLREPVWGADLGDARPTAAALMCEEAFDDGASVMVEFTAPNVETHTIGIYIDHNMGGLAKDVFLAGRSARSAARCVARRRTRSASRSATSISPRRAPAPRPRSTCSITRGTRRSTRTSSRCAR
jgi:hypothetical protein